MSVTEIAVGEDAFGCEVIEEGFAPGLDNWSEEGLGRFGLEAGAMIVGSDTAALEAFPLEVGHER